MIDDSEPELSNPGDDEAAPPSAPPRDRYQRHGLLGRGGMGRVYAAHDALLRRQVALKVAATPELAERLRREAWITGQLEHPGIVAVYDAGETDGQAWYTMRLIRGRTLRERLGACPDLAARLALLPHLHAACQAVAYAHSMGIVHRDLKPSNLMVGEFGETQVADWGLATPVEGSRDDWQRIVDTHGAVGTPRYMSPEQLRGAPASREADVFALGVALWELLAGHAPEGDAGAPPDVDALPRDAPRELAAIVRRCVAMDPRARYPDARALAEDLERWLSGRRVHAHEYRTGELLSRLVRAWRVPLAVGAVALVVVAVVVALGVVRSNRERAIAEANLAVALTAQAAAALAEERLPEAHVLAAHALRYGDSPDARGVLAATGRIGSELLEETVLPPRCRHMGIISPDGRRIACAAEGRLEVWSLQPLELLGSSEVVVVDEPVWAGDMLILETPESVVWAAGGELVPLIEESGWRPTASGSAAFATRGPVARALGPTGAGPAFTTCAANRSTTAAVGDELLVGCDAGALHVYRPTGELRLALPLVERPAWSTVVEQAGGVLVGRLDGAVQKLALPDGTWTEPLAGASRSVVSLLAVPGTPGVMVLGERGGPRIWNTESGSWVGSLPGRARQMFAGRAPGEVLLVGETLQRWRVEVAPRPSRLTFATGVSQAVPSPAGTELAVALGGGDIVERSIADGRTLRRWVWGSGVAKCVAYGDGGLLVGAAMGSQARLLGPGLASQPLEPGHILRRVGRLADGRVWGISYSSSAVIIEPRSGRVTAATVGPGPFDGSSSPSGDTAILVDTRGGLWLAAGDGWRELGREPDAVSVDVGDGGHPVVVARSHEVCIDTTCQPLEDDVIDVALHGDTLAVGTLAGDIVLLEVPSGRRVARLRGHAARVSSVEFGPDGAWLVSGSWDSTARFWDMALLDAPAADLIARAEAVWGLSLDEAMAAR